MVWPHSSNSFCTTATAVDSHQLDLLEALGLLIVTQFIARLYIPGVNFS
jgi:hypothetical protein